jgi:hypothetical protein
MATLATQETYRASDRRAGVGFPGERVTMVTGEHELQSQEADQHW